MFSYVEAQVELLRNRRNSQSVILIHIISNKNHTRHLLLPILIHINV